MRSRLHRWLPRPTVFALVLLAAYIIVKCLVLGKYYFIYRNVDLVSGPLGPKIFRNRIVAIGDLHGDLEHALKVLRLASVVDHRAKWIGGDNTILVQTGDIVDRGKDTIALYRLFSQLSQVGKVVSLMGNHEFMNVMGDWRYVTKDDIESFGGERNRRKAMSSKGWIGQLWLANYSVTTRLPLSDGFSSHLETGGTRFELGTIFDTAAASFVHGGIHPRWAAKEDAVKHINDLGKSLLWKSISGPLSAPVTLPRNASREEAELVGAEGPLWYRGYALDEDESLVCDRVEATLQDLGVRRLVMGHTPRYEGIWSRCDGRAIFIDTGISRAYGGALSALEIVYTLTPKHGSSHASQEGQPRVQLWLEREVVNALQEGRPPQMIDRVERILELLAL